VGADDILEAVRRGGLLPPGGRVVAMVSGGRDSTCLLDVAVRLLGPGTVSALHVNYRLREEADEDERHCLALCERLGVALAVERPPRPRGGNVQAWARDARYGAAARLALHEGARVAAGHTATDQAETVLHRLASSPGRRALLGMPERDGLLVRPLLAFTREDTAAYCRERKLGWREDAANDDATYTRARVRNRLVPVLREIHPAAEANLVRTARLLRDEAEVLDAAVDAVLGGRDRIGVSELAAQPPALRRLVARRLAEAPGAAASGWAALRAGAAAAARVDELLRLGAGGGSARLDLGAGVRAVVEYGVLRFDSGPGGPAGGEAVALAVPGAVRFGEWEVRCEEAEAEPRAGVLDAAALAAPLTVRAWRPGDRMAPLGLGGSRRLADLFADRRVPRERRGELPLVESGGEIAWVPGVAVGERFRVTAATRSAVRLSARAAT
jgi:tRNA(Ile)-lysidine synthase